MHTLGKQTGAILVTSLLMLVTLTVIGVSVMQMTRIQERMAGNARDTNMAFQGAEAGVRDGEDQLRLQVARPDGCSTAGCLWWQRSFLPVLSDRSAAWWNANARDYGVDGSQDMTELDTDPQYLVEELREVPDDLTVGHGPPSSRDFYQVTARSTGVSGNANTIVQSTYVKRF